MSSTILSQRFARIFYGLVFLDVNLSHLQQINNTQLAPKPQNTATTRLHSSLNTTGKTHNNTTSDLTISLPTHPRGKSSGKRVSSRHGGRLCGSEGGSGGRPGKIAEGFSVIQLMYQILKIYVDGGVGDGSGLDRCGVVELLD